MEQLFILDNIIPEGRATVLCDKNLKVVDISTSARPLFTDRIIGSDFSKHLAEDTKASLINTMNYLIITQPDEYPVKVAYLYDLKKYHAGFIQFKNYLNRYFFEIVIFKSMSDLIKDYDAKKSIYPRNKAITVDKSDLLINMNMSPSESDVLLQNLYYRALNPVNDGTTYGLIDTLYRVLLSAKHKKELLKSKINDNFNRYEIIPFVVPDLSIEVFALIIVGCLKVLDLITKEKIIDADVSVKDGKISIIFTTKVKPSENSLSGEFILSALGYLYGKTEYLVSVISYICSLYGIEALCRFKSKTVISVEFVLPEYVPSHECEVHHELPDEYKANIFDKLCDMLSDLYNIGRIGGEE